MLTKAGMFVVFVVAVGMLGMPAANASPAVSVAPSSVGAAGGTVTVTGHGFATSGSGVYVGWCRVVPQYWSSADNCADARWVHTGGAGAGQAALSPSGGFAVTLRVSPSINGASCTVPGACKVITMAAHGSADRSQDSFTNVSFAPPPPVAKTTAPKAVAPPPAPPAVTLPKATAKATAASTTPVSSSSASKKPVASTSSTSKSSAGKTSGAASESRSVAATPSTLATLDARTASSETEEPSSPTALVLWSLLALLIVLIASGGAIALRRRLRRR